MKRLIVLVALGAMAIGLRAEWLTDFAEAKKKAEAEKKPVAMLFTGSDWCPYCIKWEKETFSQAEWKKYADEKLVLVMVDFPEKKKLPRKQQKANEDLMSKFKVKEYPTLVVLDSAGKKLGEVKYTEGGASALIGKLDSVIK